MTGRNDEHAVEERLRQALAEHTADVEISPDAYARIVGRIAEDDSRHRRPGDSFGLGRGWNPVRIAATTFAAIVVAGLAAGGVMLAATTASDPDTSGAAADGAGIVDPDPSGGNGADDASSAPSNGTDEPDGAADDTSGATTAGETIERSGRRPGERLRRRGRRTGRSHEGRRGALLSRPAQAPPRRDR